MNELEVLYKECVRYGTIVYDKESKNWLLEPVRKTTFQFDNRYYIFTLVKGKIVDFNFKRI